MLIVISLMVFEVLLIFFTALYFTSQLVSILCGAPYVPMPRRHIVRLLEFGELDSSDVFFDLGAGDGRVMKAAQTYFYPQRTVGIEISMWPYLRLRLAFFHADQNRIRILHQNVLTSDMTSATCIYAYLFPELIDQLAYVWSDKLQSGTRIICPTFPIDTVKHPQFRLKKEEKIGSITAYLYEKI